MLCRIPEDRGDTFVNKSGEVDLYYTSFGWLLSYVLGIDLSMEKRRSYLEKAACNVVGFGSLCGLYALCIATSVDERGKVPFSIGGNASDAD